ncbi:hypothetical protein DHEL01_v202941 [Diaporthe helianthi]|uniref:Uncharacterized protein n=1 Tax=Diaporthe helianthi TaxID=158607 RepID=A0A2P5I824_DIAHE|nr:hypothetical protein DHEL01_v202941 [Diaporthe helianthi]
MASGSEAALARPVSFGDISHALVRSQKRLRATMGPNSYAVSPLVKLDGLSLYIITIDEVDSRLGCLGSGGDSGAWRRPVLKLPGSTRIGALPPGVLPMDHGSRAGILGIDVAYQELDHAVPIEDTAGIKVFWPGFDEKDACVTPVMAYV